MKQVNLESVELDLLVNGILQRYGYDFSQYAQSSLRRRVAKCMAESGFENVTDLLAQLLRNESLFEQFLGDMSITVTEMFRDPSFFQKVRQHVLPVLNELPVIKIWHAGCATGQEVYSMAILLAEQGCLDRCRIYATDYNNFSLVAAQKGIFSLQSMRRYAANYYASGGRADFSDYYSARYGFAKMIEPLRRAVAFANHDLVKDPPFPEVDLVVCRNVLIYFNRDLQAHVLNLFADSLSAGGILCLGSAETAEDSSTGRRFEAISESAKIYHRLAHHRGEQARRSRLG